MSENAPILKGLILGSVFLIFASTSFAQLKHVADTPSKPIRTAAELSHPHVTSRSGSSMLGIAATSLIPASICGYAIYENYTSFWLSAHRSSFHFSNDPPYALNQDKFGHAYFTALAGDVIRRGYLLAGMDSGTAMWLGTGLAFADQFTVEVLDGFHDRDPRYGFSLGDLGSDFFGASLDVIRYYYPFMRRLDYKAAVWPSDVAHLYERVFDDDESTFFWFSLNLPELLPKWLNIAVGHGVENLPIVSFARPIGARPAQQIYFGPDINLKGLPIHGEVWDIIAGILSYYRIPFPAIEITPRVKWFWLR